MKNNVEKLIEQMSLVKPTTDLDRRCRESIDHSAVENHIGGNRNVTGAVPTISLGGVVMAGIAAACLAVGFYTGMWVGTDVGQPPAFIDAGMLVEGSVGERPDVLLNKPSTVRLVDHGVFLLNGKQPVRAFDAMTYRKVQMRALDADHAVEVYVPVRKTVITPAPGA